MLPALVLSTAVGVGWWRWIRRNTAPSMLLPGEPRRLDTRLLELGAWLLQGKAPLGALNLYLDGFRLMRKDTGHQVEVHQYCAQLNEDLAQCVVFDGNTSDARLVGVEYIISERLYATLSETERALWHPHDHEVRSGLLTAPGLPEAAEHGLMKRLVRTYGKAWCTWNTEHDTVPLGAPELMTAPTASTPVRCALVEDRNCRHGTTTEEARRARRDLSGLTAAPGTRGPTPRSGRPVA